MDLGFGAGQFFGFCGSRTSQFPPEDDNGVWTGFCTTIIICLFFGFSSLNTYDLLG